MIIFPTEEHHYTLKMEYLRLSFFSASI